MKRIFCLVIAVFIFSTFSVFAETSLKAEVDKLKVATDEVLTYKVTVTSNDQLIPPVRFPAFSGFDLISQGQSQSVSLQKGGLDTSLAYSFILSPIAAGKIKIDPATLKIKDRVLSTNAFEIEVSLGKDKLRITPPNQPSLPKEPDESQEPQITL